MSSAGEKRDWVERLEAPEAQALYLHVPFCARKCAYCDFASWATSGCDPLMAAYAAGLARQLDEAEAAGVLSDVRTAYVGGGTPSLLGADLLGPLVGRVSSLGVRELTCEANPDSLGDEVLGALAGSGATRVSVGVQSLDNAELAELGRLHDADLAAERVTAAVATGLSVSCDLMCATPLQTNASWDDTLARAIGLGVSHVSVYPLRIEEGTALDARFASDPCAWNSEEIQAARMEQAKVKLEGSGFARYEVASYAMSGQACRHNKAYWTGRPYLGLGTNASSMLTLKCYLRLSAVCPQLPKAPSGTSRVRLTMTSDRRRLAESPSLSAQSFSLEFLTEGQAAAEDLMLGARLVEGLHPGLVEHATQALPPGSLAACLEGLRRDGLLTMREGRLAPTESGWLLGNELYERLWDLAPGEVTSAECEGVAPDA